MQRLPIEPISQASATQRAGRSGRLAPGVAIRLYGEADHDARPEFTEPEVRRTNLASVLLQLTSLGIDDVEELDWLDPPDPRQVKDGLALLEELGAVAEELEQDERGRVTRHRRLTQVGRTLARLPVDPRLGRMLLEADRNGCLDEVRAVVAGLSIIDVRQRPSDDEARADLAHRRFRVEGSDLLTRLALWRYLRARREESLSSSAFRRMCLAEHLHHARVREWFDLDGQLRQVCKEAGLGPNGAAARTPTSRAGARTRRRTPRSRPPSPRPCTAACCRGCCRTSASARATPPTTWGRGGRGSPIGARLGAAPPPAGRAAPAPSAPRTPARAG